MKKVILTVLVLIALGAIGVWYFIFYRPTHNKRDVSKETAIAITAQQLADAYDINETDANAKYLDKAVEVTGDLVQTGTDQAGNITAVVKGNGTTNIAITFANKAVQLQPQTTIVVQGIEKGLLESVVIVDAVLKSSKPTVAATTTAAAATTAATEAPKPYSIKAVKKDTAAAAPIVKVYSTTKAQIKFYSSGPVEDIEAINNQAVAKITEKGDINFAVLVKGFVFDNETMQEHFNGEEYMNSSKFPKATFNGKVTNMGTVNLKADGKYPVTVEGPLSIKGIIKPVKASGIIEVKGGKVSSTSKFKVKFTDYNVKTWDKSATDVEITVTANYN